MAWLHTFLSNIDVFAGPIVMLLYPLFASIKAIESKSKLDDQQWLTYWVLYSFVTLVELSLWELFKWIPFWGKIKLIAACWLVLPQFNGAAFMYDYFVKKNLLKEEEYISENSSYKFKKTISPSIQSAVSRLIDICGQDTAERLVIEQIHKYESSPFILREKYS